MALNGNNEVINVYRNSKHFLFTLIGFDDYLKGTAPFRSSKLDFSKDNITDFG